MHARRASSFGSQAAAYAEHRPDYADAAVRWALEPVSGRHPLRVLDLGAGTGKLTATIMRITPVPDVVAVEPDPAMLAELRTLLPGVTALSGRAEDIPLPDGSVDAVLCGQAAHWFTMELALPEIARVLRPGGVFSGLWNMDDDREPWVAGLAEVRLASVTLSDWRAEDHDWPPAGTSASGAFGRAELAEFEHAQVRTAESLVATIATHSKHLVMEPQERDARLDDVRSYLLSRQETAHGEFRLPLVTGVLRSAKIT
jgi:SAM-dependent methyltransferase